jgi:energy-converting hydrogenase B subunit D
VIIVIAVVLTLVLIGAAVVVFTPRPSQQAITLGVYGVLLTILFMALQAPDVALSQLAVGTAVVPLMVMLAIRKISSIRRSGRDQQ